ncbi:MAG: ASCH domain-containing protein [Ignavibacteria bacterium]|nr:ASCH domain-containing protein [Ignavibacteria bacterium]
MIDKFGDSPKMADDLLVPVLSGLKTATCSSLWEWEHEGNPIPKPGLLTVIVNGKNEPKCIIETLEVSIIKFNEADSVLAHNEGEGDLSLNYWMQVHEKYFTRTLPLIGKEFSPDMLIVCERFKVVWK